MKVYLAGEHPIKNGTGALEFNNAPYILESFFYLRDNKWFPLLIERLKDFLLDSGAFTFMSNSKMSSDWDRYLHEYAEYINKYDIKHFFELDVDAILSIKEVERMRTKLEVLTGKKCIPVWHKSRGKQYWQDMCSEYDYVAIGGMVSGGPEDLNVQTQHKYFPWFLREARARGSKVHALGYSSMPGLKKYPFYSVDSTSWLAGNRGGFLYKFDGHTLRQVKLPDGKKLQSREAAKHNFSEWVKFAQYMDNEGSAEHVQSH